MSRHLANYHRARMRSTIAVLGMSLFIQSCENPTFVERVEILNDTEYTANVDVRGQRGGWLQLTTVEAHDRSEVREVIDQGSSWIFSFKYGPHDPVQTTLTKEELIDSDWQVQVPDEFQESLRAEGVPPPP